MPVRWSELGLVKEVQKVGVSRHFSGVHCDPALSDSLKFHPAGWITICVEIEGWVFDDGE